MRVKCLAQEHNTRPGLKPGPLDLESSKLTTRLPRLPYDCDKDNNEDDDKANFTNDNKKWIKPIKK